MSAFDNYRLWRGNPNGTDKLDWVLAETADAAIAELEAENERLRKGLRLIIERNPGQAHRIAIQILDPARAKEGGGDE